MGGASSDRLPTVRSLRVLKLIAMLHENRDRLLEVVSFLPPAAIEEFGDGGSLEVACREAFDLELREGRGVDPEGSGIAAEHLGWVILPRVCASGGPAAVSALSFDREAARQKGQKWEAGMAVLFVAEAATQGVEFLTEDDFVDFTRLASVMCYLGNLEEQHSIVTAHTSPGTDQVLRVLKEGTEKLGEIVVFLPQRVRGVLLGKSFAERCLAEFDAIDTGRAGALDLKILLPVLVVLGMAERLHVTLEQCSRFHQLIAKDGTLIKRSEMVNFAQFMLALAYLDTETGQVAADNACIVLGERRVEELLEILEKDKQAASKTELLLPGHTAEYLASASFAEQCSERFQQLDVEEKGVLESLDLFQVLAELSGADPFAVSVEQCERFVATFGSCGALNQEDFTVLARHLCTMAFLHSEHGRSHLSWALECMRLVPAGVAQGSIRQGSVPPLSAAHAAARGRKESSPARKTGALEVEVQHLATDVSFYKGRSQHLEDENEALRAKMRQMEAVMRQVNGQLEEKEYHLQKISLNSSLGSS